MSSCNTTGQSNQLLQFNLLCFKLGALFNQVYQEHVIKISISNILVWNAPLVIIKEKKSHTHKSLTKFNFS